MARDVYLNTLTTVADDGVLSAMEDIQVTVKVLSTGFLATIYKGRTGATQGPTIASGAVGTNPFLTGPSGEAEFWADPGEYNIEVHDSLSIPRIEDRVLGWNSIPGAISGIPGDLISADGRLPLAALNAAIFRQFTPLGSIVDWWCPSATYDAGAGVGQPPPGWEIADGRAIPAASHDFGTGTPVTLPDLRNAFVLGAGITETYGAAAVASSDLATDAPGIGGAGGSQQRNLQHSHVVNSHSHGGATSSDGTSTDTHGGHIHRTNGQTGGNQNFAGGGGIYLAIAGDAGFNHMHQFKADSDLGGAHSHAVTAHAHTVNAEAPGMNNQLSATQDIRPKYVGLLKIMKVRRT